MISTNSFVLLVLMVVSGIFIPIILLIVWKKKTKQPIFPALLGMSIFFIFAIVLETFPKLLFFQSNNPIGKMVMSNTLLYMTVAALLAGLFEEGGRFVAFKFLLRHRNDRLVSVTYGIGHGGFEMMYLLAASGIQYIIYAVMINNGTFDSVIAEVAASAPESLAAVQALPTSIASISYYTLSLSLLERCSAIMIHIACSMIMFKSVKEKNLKYFLVAILLHASIDMIPACYQVGWINNLMFIEIGLIIYSAAFLYITTKFVYNKMPVSYE